MSKIKIILHDNNTNCVDLALLGRLLTETQCIFDRTYCYYTGKRRITATERNNFKIIANDIRQGSIILDAQLLIVALQQSMPMISETFNDPSLLVDAAFKAIDYIKALLEGLKKNEPPQVEIKDSPCTCVITGNNNTITVSPDIIAIANDIRKPLRRMANNIKQAGGATYEILSTNPALTPFKMDNSSAEIFRNSTSIISNVPISILGVVKSYNSDTCSGSFYVNVDMALPSDKYSFMIYQKDKTHADYFINSLKGDTIKVWAYVEYSTNQDTASKIMRLYLLPQNDGKDEDIPLEQALAGAK